MARQYVDTKTFADIQTNTDRLIRILNHNMTSMKNDIGWLKKLQGWQIVILTAILGGIITIAIAV